jgi:hypothetical protein
MSKLSQGLFINVVNPDWFDPTSDLPKRIQKYEDYARYFLHKILRHQKEEYDGENEFIQVSSSLMAKMFGNTHGFKCVWSALEESGVIECDGEYRPPGADGRGGKCFGFRFTEKVDPSDTKTHPITRTKLIESILAFDRESAGAAPKKKSKSNKPATLKLFVGECESLAGSGL